LGLTKLNKILVFAVVVTLLCFAPASLAASTVSVQQGYAAVQVAYASVLDAQRQGGNVTSLVAQLNGAISLLQKASSENSTNPTQANADVQTAVQIARGVETAAGPVGAQGANSRQLQFIISMTSAVAIVAVASALYVFGDRIYRRLWLRMYGNHVVKKAG
jgi:hypothetical protein